MKKMTSMEKPSKAKTPSTDFPKYRPEVKKPAQVANLKLSGSKGNHPNDPEAMRKELKKKRKARPAVVKPENDLSTKILKGKAKESLSEAVKKLNFNKNQSTPDLEGWQEEQIKGAKIYRLTAYTTVDNINKRFRIQNRQRILRKILVTILIILAIFIAIGELVDFSDHSEFDKIFGYENEGQ